MAIATSKYVYVRPSRLSISGAGEEQKFMTRSISKLLLASFLTLCLSLGASAQGYGRIDAGTTITVRTNEAIDTRESNGQVFTGTVAEDVMDRAGTIVVPRGSDVEM